MALLSDLFNPQNSADSFEYPGLLAPRQGRGLFGRVSGPQLMALGAGIASGRDWGQGIGRGFAAASQMQQQDIARDQALAPARMTYRSLVEGGMDPDEALLNVASPATAKAISDRKRLSDWQKMFLAPGAATAATAPGGYAAAVRTAESSGDDTVVSPSPLSTAGGRYGFTESTWKNMMVKYPELGLTLEGRMDPQQQELALPYLTAEHNLALRQKGIPETDPNRYALHFLGAGDGLKVLEAPDTAMVSDLVSPAAVAANPFLADMTAGEFRNWAGGKMATQPPPSVEPSPGAPQMITPAMPTVGLTQQQRSIIAAAGPDKGPALLAQFYTANAQRAQDVAEKQRAVSSAASVLMQMYPNMISPENAMTIATADLTRPFIDKMLKDPPNWQREYEYAKAQGFPGDYIDFTQAKKGKGFSVTTSDGTVIQYGGPQGGGTMPSSTAGKVGEAAFNTAKMAGRLLGIQQSYRPEFLTLGNRIQNQLWSPMLAKIDPGLLTEQDRADLTAYNNFRVDALANLNATLNELSGAAVSDQEFARISAAMPNPGTGILDGDDPLTFRDKMFRVLENANKALIRYNYYQARGGLPANLEEIPLSNVKEVDGRWFIDTPEGLMEIGQ